MIKRIKRRQVFAELIAKQIEKLFSEKSPDKCLDEKEIIESGEFLDFLFALGGMVPTIFLNNRLPKDEQKSVVEVCRLMIDIAVDIRMDEVKRGLNEVQE